MQASDIQRSLITKYKYTIYRRFTKALKIYDLLKEGDRVLVCISGGKDSMLLACLFKQLLKYSDFPFEVEYAVMDPGYRRENLAKIKDNLTALEIPAHIIKSDIFSITSKIQTKPCYLCARMRRGVLYRIARTYNCNKIALGHHYDDVIETTLMNMLNAGSFQTMLPKVHSDHYLSMELIRPLYLIREQDIINWAKTNDLTFLRCGCSLTEKLEIDEDASQRFKTKQLIKQLKKEYSPVVESNIFKAACNVNEDMILGFKKDGIYHDFKEDYEKIGEELDSFIRENDIEKKEIAKADLEHQSFEIDEELFDRFK